MNKLVVLGALGAAIGGMYLLGGQGDGGGGGGRGKIGGILGSPSGIASSGVSSAGKAKVLEEPVWYGNFSGWTPPSEFLASLQPPSGFFDEGKPYSTQSKKAYSPTDPKKKGSYIKSVTVQDEHGMEHTSTAFVNPMHVSEGSIGAGGSSYTAPAHGAIGPKVRTSTPATKKQQETAMKMSMSMATGGVV